MSQAKNLIGVTDIKREFMKYGIKNSFFFEKFIHHYLHMQVTYNSDQSDLVTESCYWLKKTLLQRPASLSAKQRVKGLATPD